MDPVATAAQMKELDRIAIQERGIPSLELMEHAAQAVTEAVRELVGPRPAGPEAHNSVGIVFAGHGKDPSEKERQEMDRLREVVESKNQDPTPRIAIFCGPGNNGGDGLAASRLLLGMGYHARTFLVGDRRKMTPDANEMAARLENCGGELERFDPENQMLLAWLATCDCVVDALFGVGLSRPVAGEFLSAVQYINHFGGRRCPVVACDLPSGVHTDTGEIMGEAVRAARTVTFTCGKPGLYLGEGGACAGEIQVAEIGIPHDLVVSRVLRGPEPIRAMGGHYVLPRRLRTAHKGDFGRLFILAGSVGYTGVPVLAASAAVRAGAGLVFLGVPRDIYPIVAVKCDEAMPFPLPESCDGILARARGCDAALIGPGLGRAPETEELVLRLLAGLDIPVILDADGINALAGHIDILDKRQAPTVLTPHDGEFQRLTGCELPIRDRMNAARDFARAHGCVLVLKGHGTITAGPDGETFLNTTGNPGMARGGSGDALAGLLAGLVGQKPLRGPHTSLAELTACGVYWHGQAGDLAALEQGEYGMTVGDLIARLPAVLKGSEEPG